jgi:hypothetical protein
MTAGGSIAHALHAGGIPWVFASQFPLWMRSSSIAVEVLYKGLLRGDDPRWLLHALRQRLRTEVANTHDWASVVAYAQVPSDFDAQVEAFCNRRARQRIEVLFDKAERLDGKAAEQEAVYEDIRRHVEQWLKALPATASAADRAERLGMWAATEKRIGNLTRDVRDARRAYERSRDVYERALQAQPGNHWVVTQFLSMTAVLDDKGDDGHLAREYGSWWNAARQIAEWDAQTATGEKKAWALGTLAELELLGVVYARAFDAAQAKAEIVRLCRELCAVVGRDAFPVSSTRRQFLRYQQQWQRDRWDDLAKAAVDALPEGKSWVATAYLGPNA